MSYNLQEKSRSVFEWFISQVCGATFSVTTRRKGLLANIYSQQPL